MRIAFAGTQSVGKTTLIEDLLQKYPSYRAHDEPIRAVAQLTGEAPPSVPTMAAEERLIRFALERMHEEPAGSCVFYDRSPIDAYAHAILSMESGGDVTPSFLASMRPLVIQSLQCCDLMVFVPMVPTVGDVHDGFRYLDGISRARVDAILSDLLESPSGVAVAAGLPVIRVTGSRNVRVAQVSAIM